MESDKIIVLDFGSQYNQLICRRIREMNVYSLLLPYDTKAKDIVDLKNVKGIVLSGGPNSVYDEGSFRVDEDIFKIGIPVLGICYGMQLISYLNKASIIPGKHKEYGGKEIKVDNTSLLFKGTPEKQIVWMSHGDKVDTLPSGFKCIASSNDTQYAAISNANQGVYAVQFHPEVRNTVYGNNILHNFVFEICKASNNWTMKDFISQKVQEIKETVKDKKVLLGISGGVDSTVAAVLISKAIGNNLTCMFINHGLLRQNEANEVMERFNNKFNIKVIKVDASEKFLGKLKGVTDPETKRKIIGALFIETFDEESKKLGHFDFLGQGTLYTDVIESGTKTAKTIKSHHNVGGLPKDIDFKLIEPLNKLFKDEVRELGRELGIDNEFVSRQPFPGPGLGIRVIGEITPEKLEIVRRSDAILREEIKNAHLETKIWQYFTCLPGFKTVGVMGDNRTYFYTVAIRAVTSIDGMTADWARIPYDVLDIISRRIVNEVPSVNRVVLDITSKPPSTIEYE
ncbi:MAG: glutamine-hydrolyzing GMP synthase [Bacilli bacterium]